MSDERQYEEAVRIVIESQQASVSLLQRRMRLGYTESARLIDEMERRGVVGPYEGSKPREVLQKAVNHEQQIGEFDDDYIAQLLGVDRAKMEQIRYATVANHDEALAQQLVVATKNEIELKKHRAKTYLSSELPVRPCTDDCPHRSSCKDFELGRVADNELCRPELRKMKKWQKAFRTGNLDELKDDVGTVAGGMAVQLIRLLEAVNKDGVVVLKPTEWGAEKMAHPALLAATKIAKDLGIDLSNFLMTPKAVKDAGPQVQVNIGVSIEQVHDRFAARFGKKDPPIEVEAEVRESGTNV